ncbi:MAG: Nre family DNA repair protein [Candidatus Bathyarchaeota archaeon]|nr:Nre family DNA repair protein [Candidatus Bathyarchaeota archaeon]
MRKLVESPRKPKETRKTRRENRWILDMLDNPSVAADLNYNVDYLIAKAQGVAWGKGLCVACKGGKFLCGKTRCPLMVRARFYLKTMPLIKGLGVDGASPPSVFVGRIGYPYVYAGPLVPPVHKDTSLYDLPERWFGKSIDEIVGFRSMLIRGKHRVHVKKFEEAGKIMERTLELALAANPVDAELAFTKQPRRTLILDDEVQPFGPSAPIRDLNVGTARWDHQIEKAYYDTDLKAANAVSNLYKQGVLVTKIQRAFSVGAFGIKKNRRLVPTRWSITAVDSIVSKGSMERIKTYPEINEYRLYESSYLDNRFEVLMLPQAWSYEAMEAWYPGTIWNPSGRTIVMYSDWEDYEGRTTYADIGGCYYAARLAVCELLERERRQATVIVMREAHPGYIMPVGVWQVRENVRNAMRQQSLKFNTLDEALARIASQFQIPLKRWIRNSELLQNALFQRKLTEYFKQA